MKKNIILLILIFLSINLLAQNPFRFENHNYGYSAERQMVNDGFGEICFDKGDPGSTVPEGWGSGYWTPSGEPRKQWGSHNNKDGHWSALDYGNGIENGGLGTWCWAERVHGRWVWYHQDYEFHPPVDANFIDLLILSIIGFILSELPHLKEGDFSSSLLKKNNKL